MNTINSPYLTHTTALKSNNTVLIKNLHIFLYILDFYHQGDLHFPQSWCGSTIKQERNFWKIEERHIAACCWNTYRDFAEQKETVETLGSAFNDIDRFRDVVLPSRSHIRHHLHRWYSLSYHVPHLPVSIMKILYLNKCFFYVEMEPVPLFVSSSCWYTEATFTTVK